MRHPRTLVAALLLFPSSALAQTPAASTPSVEPTFMDAPGVARQAGSVRSGFTVLVNLGVGIQSDADLDSTAVGFAGVNLGIGGFLTNDLALLFRFSGTTVMHDDLFGTVQQISGVVGGTLQFWVNDRFTVEAGGGIGFWRAEDEQQTSAGLILSGAGVVWKKGGHNLLVGAEYAPAFTESGTVHNLGITFGYQFHK